MQGRGLLLGAAERSLARCLVWHCARSSTESWSLKELWFSHKAAREAGSESVWPTGIWNRLGEAQEAKSETKQKNPTPQSVFADPTKPWEVRELLREVTSGPGNWERLGGSLGCEASVILAPQHEAPGSSFWPSEAASRSSVWAGDCLRTACTRSWPAGDACVSRDETWERPLQFWFRKSFTSLAEGSPLIWLEGKQQCATTAEQPALRGQVSRCLWQISRTLSQGTESFSETWMLL